MTFTPPNSHSNGLPLGLAGATAATRYVGATASGAPASGAFVVGDFVIDQTGKVYVCSVAGSPGTWVQAGGGTTFLKDYVQVTSPVAITATSEGTAQVLVTGTSLVWDGSTAYLFEFFSPEWQDTVTSAAFSVVLYDGSAVVAYIFVSRANQANVPQGSISGMYRFTPAAGTRAYSARGFVSGVSTATIGGGAGGGSADAPMFLRATAS